VSPQARDILARAQQAQAIPQSTGMYFPKLKVAPKDDKDNNILSGEFYTEKRVPKEGSDNEFINKRQSIGRQPPVVILDQRYWYKYYVKASGMVAQTNEFRSFDEMIYLKSMQDNRYVLETALPYPQFKEYKEAHYYDSVEKKSKLSFRVIFYVLYDGEIYRMDTNKSSLVGIPEGQKDVDFKNPQPLSFKHYQKNLMSSEYLVYFTTKCKLASKEVLGDVPWHYVQFEAIERLEGEELNEAANAWQKQEDLLTMQFEAQFRQLIDASDGVIEADTVDVSFDDGDGDDDIDVF